MTDDTHLWRLTWTHGRGVFWLHMRACAAHLADDWLKVYRKDEPTATFALSKHMPALPADADTLARHPATL